MNTPTIPEIADMIRHHKANDNEAGRLVAEHIMPIFGVEIDDNKRMESITAALQAEEELKDELARFFDSLEDTIKDIGNSLDEIDHNSRVRYPCEFPEDSEGHQLFLNMEVIQEQHSSIKDDVQSLRDQIREFQNNYQIWA